MNAAFLNNPGPPEEIQYGDLPKPTPKEGEVLVRVKVSALNPIDLYIRSGMINMPLPKPYSPGCDLAGVVEAVGAGVERFKRGDRVWGSNQGLLGRQGTLAEYACVEEGFLYATPDGVSDEEAAAAALVGITAHLGLFRCARLQSGETVFVNGGTGGVGSMVVQMTKAVGGKAIATAGSDEKVKLCRSWGADRVVNYKTENVDAAIKEFTGDKGLNVWYETQREPDFMRMVPLMAPRGRMIVMAGRQAQPIFPVGPFYVKDLSLFGFAMFNASKAEQQECAKDINRWLAEKKLHVPIGKSFPLSQAALAHRLLEENTLNKAGTLVGKVIVEV
jgi:NADPH2:quinone reductase